MLYALDKDELHQLQTADWSAEFHGAEMVAAVFGYPKKMAESITLSEHGSTVIGSAVRKGTEILRIELDPKTTEDVEKLAMTGVPDPEDPRSFTVTAYMFKHFMSPTMRGFDYVPRLVAEPVVLRPRPDVRCGAGTVRLTSSPYDPLGEVPVRELIVCAYGRFDNAMLPGKVVGRTWWLPGFLKHAFFKVDVAPVKLGWVDDVTLSPPIEGKNSYIEGKL